MTRLILYVLISLGLTLGITWLLGVPGSVRIDLAGYRMQPGIGVFIIILLLGIAGIILAWSLVRRILSTPAFLQRLALRRRQNLGIEALSNSIIALQAGDARKARQLAREAQGKLPGNAAAQLLEARADLALGRWTDAQEQYRALIDNPRTALAALSGLYEQAVAQNNTDAAIAFAHKAHTIAPDVEWANAAIFKNFTDQKKWAAALKLVHAEPAGTREEKQARKRRLAVLHTAIAMEKETTDSAEALDNARVALKLEPDFVPAALIAARIHSNKGEVRKSMSLLKRTWRATRHPHVATLYANAQPGISPVERLKRIKDLVPSPPPDETSANVVARIAIQARQWSDARNALAAFVGKTPSQATCVAMAQIEEGQNADHGRARQWLARAVSAPRDPVWVADGVTANEWAPVSPVTGQLDAFEFRVPTSTLTHADSTEPQPREIEINAKPESAPETSHGNDGETAPPRPARAPGTTQDPSSPTARSDAPPSPSRDRTPGSAPDSPAN